MRASVFKLRPVQGSDGDAIYALFEQIQLLHANKEPTLFRQPERGALFEQFLQKNLTDPDQHLIVACRDDRVVGYTQYAVETRKETLIKPERRVLFIYEVVVDEAERGVGCGSLLVEHAKQTARDQDIHLVGIDWWWFNDAARACFGKAGFEVKQEHAWLDPHG